MSNRRKNARQQRAARRLSNQLDEGNKTAKDEKGELVSVPLSDSDRQRISTELSRLGDYVQGLKRAPKAINKKAEKPEDKWFIDIYTVSTSYAKRSERRKTKGAKGKKIKRVKSKAFLKTVIAREGDAIAYREGRMGLSPKNHIFIARKESPSFS